VGQWGSGVVNNHGFNCCVTVCHSAGSAEAFTATTGKECQ
jgi:hypothetical protein